MFDTFKRIEYLRLGASFDTCDPVTHGVQASLGGIDLDNHFQLGFATSQFVLPVLAVGLALLHDLLFWIFTFLEHLVDVTRFGNAR